MKKSMDFSCQSSKDIRQETSSILSSRRTRTIVSTTILSILGALTAFHILSSPFPLKASIAVNEKSECTGHLSETWSWAKIKPSKDLVWTPCSGGFQCTRLDVPLDWLEPSEEKRVAVAMIKLPATDLQNYKGHVFFNPGGPGGSGVQFMRERASAIQKIIGTNHDLISFDPRGVGATTPSVNCFPSDQLFKVWNMGDPGDIDSHPGVIYDRFARASAESASCIANSPEIIQYVSTTSVARDMLEMVEKTGEKRLKYWGTSYGTMLGGMFAALYPDKVGRLVSDGNVDYGEWTKTAHINALHDADKIFDAFFDMCHKAGPLACHFYSSTPAKIEERLNILQAKLKLYPVIVPSGIDGSQIPQIITYSRLRRVMSSTLYDAVQFFSGFATILAALEKGDGRPLVHFVSRYGYWEPFSWSCDAPRPPPFEVGMSADAFRAIMCTDGGAINESVEEFKEYAEGQMNMSRAAGAVNTLFRLACAGWNVKAKWAFHGPFTGNTSHPILYIANKADNVTPLRSARMNSAGFPGSVVMIQDSLGHTSLTAPSICTAKYIRAYFQHGTLPPPETHCEEDIQPFGGAAEAPAHVRGVEDEEIWNALMELRGSANRIMMHL